MGRPNPLDVATAVSRAAALLADDGDDRTAQPPPSAPTADTAVIRFGDCELDLDLQELRRNGERVGIEPQVFDVLAYLVSHRGAVVSREELLDEVWGDRFVSFSALSSRISAARQATGDDGPATQGVIRTVHGKGFTFVADVIER